MKKRIEGYQNIIQITLLAGLSYLTGISLAMVSGYGITGIEWMIPCLILFAGVIYYKAAVVLSIGKWEAAVSTEQNKKNNAGTFLFKTEFKYSLTAGFIYALTIVAGSKIEIYDGIFHDVSMMDFFVYPFLGLFFSALILLLFAVSDKVSMSKEMGKKETCTKEGKNTRVVMLCKSHPMAALFILYLICYLPYFLTFFPGNCGADTWESLSMVEGLIPWTNHHPVLFTATMMVVRKLTGFLPMTGSVAVFSFLQMMAVAAVLSYLTLRILRTRVHVLCKIFALAMFALHPFMGMYSIYLSKDVLFSVIMVLLSMKLYDVLAGKGELLAKPLECVKLSVLFLLSSMLRNNGMYIAIIMAVIFLILHKKYWKQILILFAFAIGLFQIWQGPVFRAIGIEKQSFAEAASVPLQQIGYVLWEGETFSEEDMAFLEELMPIEKVKEVYQPGYTDPYKFDEAFNDDFLNDNVGKFLGVWWNGCKSHFGSYVKAYLMQTVGYWHYGETNSVCTQGCTENELGVAQVDIIENITGISLEPVFEKLVLAGRKAPIVCVLGSMAMQISMVFLLILQYVRRKCAKQAIWLLPLVILWGTIMIATPAFCLLRYLFPIFLLWPILLAEFFKS